MGREMCTTQTNGYTYLLTTAFFSALSYTIIDNEIMESYTRDRSLWFFNKLIGEVIDTERRKSIIKVPPYIKSSNPNAYIPHMVSIGPYHHGREHLKPMDALKRKCVHSFMQRSGADFQLFNDTFREWTPQLMQYYEHLDEEWRNEEKFLELMVVDGCFLLECFYCIAKPNGSPLSNLLHGTKRATITRDMILIENQLPLQVLQILLQLYHVQVEPDFTDLNGLIKKFFGQMSITIDSRSVHLLDVVRESSITRFYPAPETPQLDAGPEVPSATVLSLIGLKFKEINSSGIDFDETRGILWLPFISVDDITETWFLNHMALERCEVVERNGISSYISFMGMLIRTAQDVKLLRHQGIIRDSRIEKSDKAIAKLFTDLAQNTVINSDGSLHRVRFALHKWSASSRGKWNVRFAEWGSNFILTYCKNPWKAIGLVAGTILLAAGVTQTVYAVLQFYK